MTFGELLRFYRLKRGFGLTRFTDLVKLKPSELVAIENSRCSPLDVQLLGKALGLTPEEWLGFKKMVAEVKIIPDKRDTKLKSGKLVRVL